MSALIGAIGWIEAVITGTIATAVAILAVASIGLALLGGWTPLRRSGAKIIGCFIIFASSQISSALVAALSQSDSMVAPLATSVAPIPSRLEAPPILDDPYGGAAAPPPKEDVFGSSHL